MYICAYLCVAVFVVTLCSIRVAALLGSVCRGEGGISPEIFSFCCFFLFFLHDSDFYLLLKSRCIHERFIHVV